MIRSSQEQWHQDYAFKSQRIKNPPKNPLGELHIISSVTVFDHRDGYKTNILVLTMVD
jgi:hypothetical protein